MDVKAQSHLVLGVGPYKEGSLMGGKTWEMGTSRQVKPALAEGGEGQAVGKREVAPPPVISPEWGCLPSGPVGGDRCQQPASQC